MVLRPADLFPKEMRDDSELENLGKKKILFNHLPEKFQTYVESGLFSGELDRRMNSSNPDS